MTARSPSSGTRRRPPCRASPPPGRCSATAGQASGAREHSSGGERALPPCELVTCLYRQRHQPPFALAKPGHQAEHAGHSASTYAAVACAILLPLQAVTPFFFAAAAKRPRRAPSGRAPASAAAQPSATPAPGSPPQVALDRVLALVVLDAVRPAAMTSGRLRAAAAHGCTRQSHPRRANSGRRACKWARLHLRRHLQDVLLLAVVVRVHLDRAPSFDERHVRRRATQGGRPWRPCSSRSCCP